MAKNVYAMRILGLLICLFGLVSMNAGWFCAGLILVVGYAVIGELQLLRERS